MENKESDDLSFGFSTSSLPLSAVVVAPAACPLKKKKKTF